MDLDEVAQELYGLAPGVFTQTRDARATQARDEGDKALAAAIKKLRRPTVGAWLANLLVRERHEEVNRLLDLGTALRQATEQLAAADLRQLSQQRHRVVAALVEEARRLAAERDRPPSEATIRELTDTLEAALADPEATDQLTGGRLTGALHYTGFTTSAPANGSKEPEAPEVPAKQRPTRRTTPAPHDTARQQHDSRQQHDKPEQQDKHDERQQQERRHRAEEARRQAEHALAEATSATAALKGRLDQLNEEQAHQSREIDELERRLQRLRGEAARTHEQRRQTEQRLEAATERERAAQHAADEARAELQRQS